MFFILSKTISFLIKPVTLVIISFLLAAFLKKEKHRKRFFWIGLGMLLVFSNEFISNQAIGWWEARPLSIQDVSYHEYAVVLGGMVDLTQEPRDRVYFNQSVDRILHTLKLYRAGKIGKILVTGGSGSIYDQSVKEGVVLETFILENGVERTDLIIESNSRNTFENAKLTKELIPPDKSGRILLITSGTHMRRASACYRKAGYELTLFPTSFLHDEFRLHTLYTPSADALRKWETIFKEIFGYLAYALVGYL